MSAAIYVWRRRDGRELARRMREAHAFELSKNIDAWDMGPLGGPMAASRLGAGRFLSSIGRRENFGGEAFQRRRGGVLWGAWLEHL